MKPSTRLIILKFKVESWLYYNTPRKVSRLLNIRHPNALPECDNVECDGETCQECCPHDEFDHGICLACDKDCTDDLAGRAESYYEGDR